jgi:hypothetical protein
MFMVHGDRGMVVMVGSQQVIDNSEKELKIGPIFGLKTAFLGVKRALLGILDSYAIDMRTCSLDGTKTRLMSLQLTLILLSI